MNKKDIESIKDCFNKSCSEKSELIEMPPNFISNFNNDSEFKRNASRLIMNDILTRLNNILDDVYQFTKRHQKLNEIVKLGIDITDKYFKEHRLKEKKNERLNGKKAIDIINEDIYSLERIFYNNHLMKYFTKHTITYPDGTTTEKEGKISKNTIYTGNPAEHGGDIYLVLQDLYKIKRLSETSKGTLSIVKINKEITFNRINNDYLETLYYIPKINLEQEMLNLFISFEGNKNKTKNKKIKQTIHNYFNSETYSKKYNRLSKLLQIS